MIKRPKSFIKQSCFKQTKNGRFEYVLVRSSSRRTLAITINEKAEVKVSVPYRARQDEVNAFLEEKSHWIINNLMKAQQYNQRLMQKRFSHGEKFLFLGKENRIEVKVGHLKRARIEYTGETWQITLPDNRASENREQLIKRKMIAWYRKQAEEILGGRIFHYSRIMKVEPKKITVKTLKRIWGNCDHHLRTIHLNWQIILSPIEVVDYVVVHELCHLLVPNHSKRFWSKVAKIMPNYKKYKNWLKTHSVDMHLP